MRVNVNLGDRTLALCLPKHNDDDSQLFIISLLNICDGICDMFLHNTLPNTNLESSCKAYGKSSAPTSFCITPNLPHISGRRTTVIWIYQGVIILNSRLAYIGWDGEDGVVTWLCIGQKVF